jgi:hypothetical protein
LPSPSDYRALAQECSNKASAAHGESRDVLLQLAQTYTTLAAVAETQDHLKEFFATRPTKPKRTPVRSAPD